MGVLDLFVFGVLLLIEHVGQTIELRYLCYGGLIAAAGKVDQW